MKQSIWVPPPPDDTPPEMDDEDESPPPEEEDKDFETDSELEIPVEPKIRGLVHHVHSKEAKAALEVLTQSLVSFARDTMTYPPNGEWTDFTYNITDAEGDPYLVITAEEKRSFTCRRKGFLFKVMTVDGYPICSIRCKINIWSIMTIVFDKEHELFGSIVQPKSRPYYRLQNHLGIHLFRILPENRWEYRDMPLRIKFGFGPLPSELLVFSLEGSVEDAKLEITWDARDFPVLFSRNIYPRTSGVCAAWNPRSRLDCWQRLLIIALQFSLNILNGVAFYDSGDFVEGFGHPDRGWCDRKCNWGCCRPKEPGKWSATLPTPYNYHPIPNYEPDDTVHRMDDIFNQYNTVPIEETFDYTELKTHKYFKTVSSSKIRRYPLM